VVRVGAILYLIVLALYSVGLVAALRVDKLERNRAGIPRRDRPMFLWINIALVSILSVALLGVAI
jgi:hypothetical protein